MPLLPPNVPRPRTAGRPPVPRPPEPRPPVPRQHGRRRRPVGAAAVGLLTLLALAGCSADASDEAGVAGSSAVQGEAAAPPAAGGAADAQAGAPPERAVGAAAAPAAVTRRVRTAELTVEVTDLRAAAARVRATAAALGGGVSSESTGYSEPAAAAAGEGTGAGDAAPSIARGAAGGESVIVLRVPEPALEQALERVAGTGRELSRTGSSEDVTAPLADLASRVATQQRSLERVRGLLGRAGSLQDVVLLERELAEREAELEALQARQRSLADRADLATVTAVLRMPGVVGAGGGDLGFGNGLADGWRAVQHSTAVVLTVLGALLPFAVVLAVIGVPAVAVWRRVRRRRATQAATVAPAVP